MYSATLGMLWSGCTSTFMPFLSVRVLTGNSCDCAHTGEAAMLKRQNNHNALERYQIAFMNPPSDKPFHLKTQVNPEMFAIFLRPSRQQRKHADRPVRTTFELEGRHNEERTVLRQFAQIRKILQMIEPRPERQAMHRKIL